MGVTRDGSVASGALSGLADGRRPGNREAVGSLMDREVGSPRRTLFQTRQRPDAKSQPPADQAVVGEWRLFRVTLVERDCDVDGQQLGDERALLAENWSALRTATPSASTPAA
jgi:hypothetical protein